MIEQLTRQIEVAETGLPPDVGEWVETTSTILRVALGRDNPNYISFNTLRLTPMVWSPDTPDSRLEEAKRSGVQSGLRILRAAVRELQLTAITEAAPTVSAGHADAEAPVFIVHGRNNERLQEVARTVQRLTDRQPIILHEQADAGRTIMEKFEDHAAAASFAIVLLTGDDVGGIAGGLTQPRPRQNVVFEAGYFVGKLGRSRVALLYEPDVELPSDLDGVLYTKLDAPGAWRHKLGKEMREAGLDADTNRL